MNNVTFSAGLDDGQHWSKPSQPLELVYMQITPNKDADVYAGNFSGWVSPEVRRLVLAAPHNQRKVHEHEALIGKLKELLDKDGVDDARDLVKTEHDAINGSRD